MSILGRQRILRVPGVHGLDVARRALPEIVHLPVGQLSYIFEPRMLLPTVDLRLATFCTRLAIVDFFIIAIVTVLLESSCLALLALCKCWSSSRTIVVW